MDDHAESRGFGPRPGCQNLQLALYGMRRIAVGGLNDAFAASALMGSFGMGFRRPLILLRAFMAELARHSRRQIAVAPCCFPRTTAAEFDLLSTLAVCREDPRDAHARLSALMAVESCVGALSSAQATAQAFADLGRPFAAQDSLLTEAAFPMD